MQYLLKRRCAASPRLEGVAIAAVWRWGHFRAQDWPEVRQAQSRLIARSAALSQRDSALACLEKACRLRGLRAQRHFQREEAVPGEKAGYSSIDMEQESLKDSKDVGTVGRRID